MFFSPIKNVKLLLIAALGIFSLMSCIAMSVGLGNVWRFPFTALDNGGGAFLLPYLVVLFVIGRPLYFLEMVIGQFSSRNSIDVFDISPFFRGKFITKQNIHVFVVYTNFLLAFHSKGAGVGQVIAVFLLSTYYASIMSLIGRYLWDSFKSPLPWTVCKETWANCVDPSGYIVGPNASEHIYSVSKAIHNGTVRVTSSEYYFK